MTAERIKARLLPELGAEVHVYPTLPSTNLTLRQLAAEGAPDGTVVIARTQTAGRGRLGRSFASPEGAGLYLSLLLRRSFPSEFIPLLTPYAAVAAAHAVEECADLQVGIKWVNDLRVGEKKIAGILTEGILSPEGVLCGAVVGVGINILPNALPDELREIAAAIGDFTAPPKPEVLAGALITHLLSDLPSLLDRSFLQEYRARSVVIGRTVTAIDGDTHLTGVAEAIEDDGALRLTCEDGAHLLRAGEVSIRM